MHSHRAEVQEPPQLCPPLLSDQRCQLMIVNLIMFPWALGLATKDQQRSPKTIPTAKKNNTKPAVPPSNVWLQTVVPDDSEGSLGLQGFQDGIGMLRPPFHHMLVTVPASLYEEFNGIHTLMPNVPTKRGQSSNFGLRKSLKNSVKHRRKTKSLRSLLL